MYKPERCPKCSGTDLLIYGGFNSAISCGVCESNKNPDKAHEIRMKEWEEFKKKLDDLIIEFKKGKKC